MIEILPVVIYHLTAKAMEGMDSDAVGICPNDAAQALAHRRCSTVGKGKAENILRQHVRLAQDVGGAHAEQFCLASTGASHNEQWPIDRIDGGALLAIEVRVSSRKFVLRHVSIIAHSPYRL